MSFIKHVEWDFVKVVFKVHLGQEECGCALGSFHFPHFLIDLGMLCPFLRFPSEMRLTHKALFGPFVEVHFGQLGTYPPHHLVCLVQHGLRLRELSKHLSVIIFFNDDFWITKWFSFLL